MVVPTPTKEAIALYVRVVRFADVNSEQVEGLLARINEADGPPPGVTMSRMELAFDEGQGTALSLQYYETAEDMEAAARVFGDMDSSATPGTRVSVDTCEVKLELSGS